MDHIVEIFTAIARTLATVRTDNADGNWAKLLGCIKACGEGAALCKAKEEDVNEDA